MNPTYLHCINLTWLLVNATGAALLIFFTSPPLDVTEHGENFFAWRNDPPSPEARTANLKKYIRHKYGFKGGVVMLTVGYVFQIIAAVLA